MREPELPSDEELDLDLERARALARIMDSQFNIMGVEMGADAILGLIPGVGDTISMVIGCYPIHLAKKHNLGTTVQLRMAKNVAVDWAVGLVPLVGDILDVAYKANVMNYRLLEEAVAKRRRKQGRGPSGMKEVEAEEI